MDDSKTGATTPAAGTRSQWPAVAALIATLALAAVGAVLAWNTQLPLVGWPWLVDYLYFDPGVWAATLWLRLLSVAAILIIGPLALLLTSMVLRRHAKAWLFLPVLALLAWAAFAFVVHEALPETTGIVVYKPVIYLYPERATTIRVDLELEGELTLCEPRVDPGTTGWTVEASPDGTVVADDGATYPYLFWEGVLPLAVDTTEGFVVPGSDTRAFLDDALARQGLTASERADFIEYWAPRMESHPFVFVRFEGAAYERVAGLRTDPVADTTIRVFMVFEGLDTPRTVGPQRLPESPVRTGFVVVEWGGAQLQSDSVDPRQP